MMSDQHGQIDVISCGTGFPSDADFSAILQHADAVYLSRKMLQLCPLSLQRVHLFGASAASDAADALALCRAGKRIAVLASGDALFHGFGGTLAAIRKDELVIFHPCITAFQALFARLGLAWDAAEFFSVHCGCEIPVRAICAARMAVIYGGSRYPAHEIARSLQEFAPLLALRPAVLAENLGGSDERILSASLAEVAAMKSGWNSMLLLLPQDSVESAMILPLGLPVEHYEREKNLITSPEIRAVMLAKLRLPLQGIFWDIGAGSGSVGLEAAALCPNLSVHAVECNPARCAMIERNRIRMGITNFILHQMDAMMAISILPEPDRIFIGGGGEKLQDIADAAFAHLHAGGYLVITAVTLESLQILMNWNCTQRTDFCRLDIAHAEDIAGHYQHFRAQNTIYLFTFEKK